MKCRFIAVFFVLFLTFSNSAFTGNSLASMEVEVEINSEVLSEEKKGDFQIPASDTSSVEVKGESRVPAKLFFSPYVLGIERNHERRIYDFREKKILDITDRDKSFSSYSLYSIPGFRLNELNKRILIARMYEKGRPEAKPFSIVHAEISLAIRDEKEKGTGLVLVESDGGKKIEAVFEGETVSVAVLSEEKLDEVSKNGLRRYLYLECTLHPEFIDAVISKQKLPLALCYISPGLDRRITVKQRFARWRINIDVPTFSLKIPSDYLDTSFQILGMELANIISDVRKPERRPLSRAEYEELAEAAFSDGKYVDALLIGIECALVHGTGDVGIFSKIATVDYEKETELKNVLTATGLATPDKAREALKLLSSIPRSSYGYAHILDIFIANALTKVGGEEEAETILVSVLKKNPFLTGVYKDLGDIFYNSERAREAWLLWETARSIMPFHPMLEPVRELELELERKYPSFF